MIDCVPLVRLVLQREAADCGVAALATIAGVSYEDALRAVVAIDGKHQGKCGLYIRQLEAASERLGKPLRRRRVYDLDADMGLLSIVLPAGQSDHIALLVNGLIANTDGTLWDADVYLRHHKAKAGVLLVPAEA